jgi:hypothetical protein
LAAALPTRVVVVISSRVDRQRAGQLRISISAKEEA